MQKKIFIFIIFLIPNLIFSQVQDSSFVSMISASYGFQIPSGDLADRFGVSSSIGTSFNIKTKKNWIFGIEADYIFGNNVKEDNILDSLKTSKGNILSLEGEFANYVFYERGFFLALSVGKVIPLHFSNPNSGILIKTKIGFLQHHIRIENEANNTPAILDDYTKGYDRLSNGISSNIFVGYIHFANNNITNFYAGLELTYAHTKNRRDYNFDLMKKDDSQRVDIFIGIKVGWLLKFKKRMSAEYYTF